MNSRLTISLAQMDCRLGEPEPNEAQAEAFVAAAAVHLRQRDRQPRAVADGGFSYLVWDFNDVDVSAAQDPLNSIYFWVQVDDVPTYPNVWAHGSDARTIFPDADVPAESCR